MIGRTVSHYRILAELGSGGMGVVYRAEDLVLGRPVAVKFLNASLAADPEARRRFVHEARAAAALDHSAICTVYETGEADGQPFIAMACLEGRTLKERIADGPLPLAEALGICVQIADALNEAHGKGVVHRDVKPSNIMLTPKGQVKVMDFGLAQVAGASQLTRSGTTLGTAAYLSPEQARGDHIDHRSDLWSLGVVLYEMVAGQRPFAGDHEAALMNNLLHGEPTPLTARRAGLPRELDDLVAKCLAKEPSRRYQHADDLAVDLRRLLSRLDLTETIAGRWSPRPRWRRPVTVATVGVLLIAAAWAISRGVRRDEDDAPSRHAPPSLAVLPFENIGGDSQQDYFVEGMHEALITNLSRSGELSVISRTSVLRYQGTQSPLTQIAHELKVDRIIEGSVLRVGERVRIAARLVDAGSDRQLWAQSYERDLNEVLQLQREVAEAIVSEIGAVVRPAAIAAAAGAPQVDPEAYEAYSRGRYHWNLRSKADMLEAIAQFRRAIEIAPGFAEAHAGLADVYSIAAMNADLEPRDCFPLARQAALRALELNGTLAAAHVSLAFVQHYYDMDRAAAAASYREAIRLDPNYAVARQWHAIFMEQDGRLDEALAEIEHARKLDPMSAVMHANVARRYAIASRFGAADAAMRRALQLNPELPFVQGVQAEIEFIKGNYRLEAEILARIGSGASGPSRLGPALLAASENPDRRVYLETRLRAIDDHQSSGSKHDELIKASCLAQLGRIDECVALCASWFDEQRSAAQWLKVYPPLEPARSDPRFELLLGRAGLNGSAASSPAI